MIYTANYDPVNNPKHYCNGDIECIDAMISALGIQAVMNFCQGNAFKYIWRMNLKNGEEDAKKAVWYVNKWIELNQRKQETSNAEHEDISPYLYI